jgi:hypothetical protein
VIWTVTFSACGEAGTVPVAPVSSQKTTAAKKNFRDLDNDKGGAGDRAVVILPDKQWFSFVREVGKWKSDDRVFQTTADLLSK